MKIWWRGAIITLVWLQLSGLCFAKQLFLKDGSVLDCESFWKRNNQVVAKVNRDVVLTFQASEVNLAKSFHRTKKKTVKKKLHRVRKTHGAVLPGGPAASKGGDAGTSGSFPAANSSSPDQKGATAPVPPPQKRVKAAANAKNPESKDANAPAPPAQKASAQPQNGGAPVAPAGDAKPAAGTPPVGGGADAPAAKAAPSPQPGAAAKPAVPPKPAVAPKPAAQAKPEVTAEMKQKLMSNLILILVSLLLIIAGMWKVFEKAGYAGWKAIIPFYNMYLLMIIAGKPGWWFFLLFIPVVGIAILLLAYLSLAEKFGKSALFAVGLVFFPMLCFPALGFDRSQYGARKEELEFSFSEE
ncbi:DUF5684 domain-containing protein [Geomonas sp. Red32]|uniref:DUF5684 domain-containing protein n=1 Tax=Geomonas sp. Red32 TaxID=2912856 RepID=UPI00202CB7FB|nr:DUF5684 domain-containing protein [Geomonas sp. Red32]MCM0083444.1 DUF5684 domain-containing protein [Geomonas sp. Red32]